MLLCRLEPSRHRMAHLSLAAPGPGYPSIMPLLRGDIWVLDVSLCTAAAHASACRALTSCLAYSAILGQPSGGMRRLCIEHYEAAKCLSHQREPEGIPPDLEGADRLTSDHMRLCRQHAGKRRLSVLEA